MDQIYYTARTFNQLVLTVLLLLMMFLIMAPWMVGTWQAQRDIAYDQIWMTHVGDCDCTAELP